jgi:hypothetical protein
VYKKTSKFSLLTGGRAVIHINRPAIRPITPGRLAKPIVAHSNNCIKQ